MMLKIGAIVEEQDQALPGALKIFDECLRQFCMHSINSWWT